MIFCQNLSWVSAISIKGLRIEGFCGNIAQRRVSTFTSIKDRYHISEGTSQFWTCYKTHCIKFIKSAMLHPKSASKLRIELFSCICELSNETTSSKNESRSIVNLVPTTNLTTYNRLLRCRDVVYLRSKVLGLL